MLPNQLSNAMQAMHLNGNRNGTPPAAAMRNPVINGTSNTNGSMEPSHQLDRQQFAAELDEVIRKHREMTFQLNNLGEHIDRLKYALLGPVNVASGIGHHDDNTTSGTATTLKSHRINSASAANLNATNGSRFGTSRSVSSAMSSRASSHYGSLTMTSEPGHDHKERLVFNGPQRRYPIDRPPPPPPPPVGPSTFVHGPSPPTPPPLPPPPKVRNQQQQPPQQYIEHRINTYNNNNESYQCGTPQHLWASKGTPALMLAQQRKAQENNNERKSEKPPALPPAMPKITNTAPNANYNSFVEPPIRSHNTQTANEQPLIGPSTSSLVMSSQSSSVIQTRKEDQQKEQSPIVSEDNMKTSSSGKAGGDLLGPCPACLQDVEDPNDACKAMGQIYHAQCFVCSICKCMMIRKEFYHVSGKVFCESDYQTHVLRQVSCFECKQPINDTMLEAMDNFYHPACLKCCVCGVCLDDVKFTIDQHGKLFCAKDYYQNYGPICNRCKKPITPLDDNEGTTAWVTSRNHDYHVDCYSCEECNVQLTDDESARCYPIGDHLFCQRCYLSKDTDLKV